MERCGGEYLPRGGLTTRSYHFDPLVNEVVRYAPKKTVLETVFEGEAVPHDTAVAQALPRFRTDFFEVVRTTVRWGSFFLCGRATRFWPSCRVPAVVKFASVHARCSSIGCGFAGLGEHCVSAL